MTYLRSCEIGLKSKYQVSVLYQNQTIPNSIFRPCIINSCTFNWCNILNRYGAHFTHMYYFSSQHVLGNYIHCKVSWSQHSWNTVLGIFSGTFFTQKLRNLKIYVLIVYRTCHDVIYYRGPHTLRGSVLCCLPNEFFLIGSYSSGKSDEYYQKRYYLHDMVNCLINI